MSDTHREQGICAAIDILTGAKIARASFDRTIKGIVKAVTDKTIGEYEIKYQDSTFPAYATDSKMVFIEGQEVDILIPGNDWDRKKIILRATNATAVTYQEVKPSHELYNSVGENGLEKRDTVFALRSGYEDNDSNLTGQKIVLYNAKGKYPEGQTSDYHLDINQNKIKSYINQSDGIALSMKVRTELLPTQRGPGTYRMVVSAYIKNDQGKTNLVDLILSDIKCVHGDPYNLATFTDIQTFITNINTKGFQSIEQVRIECFGFNSLGKTAPFDIFIRDLSINGGNLLSGDELTGYSLHIDYSRNGKILGENVNGVSVSEVVLEAQLKAKGVIIPKDVEYYWFIKDGTIYQNSINYFAKAGQGWRSLNVFGNQNVAFSDGLFTVKQTETSKQQEYCTETKVSTLLCVALYSNGYWKKQIEVIDLDKKDIRIESSDKKGNQNRTIYYFGLGNPRLTCKVYEPNGEQTEDSKTNANYTYTWSVYNSTSNSFETRNTTSFNAQRNIFNPIKNKIFSKVDSIIQSNRANYKNKNVYLTDGTITSTEKNNLQNIVTQRYGTNDNSITYAKIESLNQYFSTSPLIARRDYYNFPINTIVDSITVYCTVKKDNVYIGTGSITLYNKFEVEGQYNLVIENGSQVFQYDGNGNSPCGPAVQKPLDILPLSFTLLDNTGTEIPYQAIINQGRVWWMFPDGNTLLKTDYKDNIPNSTLTGADSALAAGFLVYANRPTFSFSIANEYDFKKTNNYIRLNIKYRDFTFNAYTTFSFPKDGDPGTNGTHFFAKLEPVNSTLRTDRYYISAYVKNINQQNFIKDTYNNLRQVVFNDDGNKVDYFYFNLYKSSGELESRSFNLIYSPPAYSSGQQRKGLESCLVPKSYAKDTNNLTYPHFSLTLNLKQDSNNKYIVPTLNSKCPYTDIVRVQRNATQTSKVNYFAELPICVNYLQSQLYRIKVRPKTGFSYVVYSSDGTLPDYSSQNPFQIVVEKVIKQGNNEYWMESTEQSYIWENQDKTSSSTKTSKYYYEWNFTGNFSTANISPTLGKNSLEVNPKNTFDGNNLNSVILCKVSKRTGTIWVYNNNTKKWEENPVLEEIGFISIPIYMSLNRYENRALNGWDGNSLQLDGSGNGQILTPQIGAGAKDINNDFTGMVMGQLDLNTNNADIGTKGDIGLMGYDAGVRTIFLDAKTGKAQFGKNNQAKIIIDPDAKWKTKGTDAALLYSNGFNSTAYLNQDGKNYTNDHYGSGLMIDLTSPSIQFGSGHFYVTKNGDIHAGGNGQIAGWSISNNQIYKNYTGMASSDIFTSSIGANKPDSKSSVAFYAGTKDDKNNFYVTHNGYLFSKSGQIAGWDITPTRIWNQRKNSQGKITSEVGISVYSDEMKKDVSAITGKKSPDNKFFAFWAGNDSDYAQKNFFVTHDGYLRAKYGKIATWSITSTALENGKVGMGQKPIQADHYNGNHEWIYKNDKGKWKRKTTSGEVDEKENTSLEARFWAYSNETDVTASSAVFIVDKFGNLYSNAGKIGGWHITQDRLQAENEAGGKININSNGSIQSGNYTGSETGKTGWSINADGVAIFNEITASNKGTIGGWEIGSGSLKKGNIELVSSGSKEKSPENGGSNQTTYIKAGNLILFGTGSIKGDGWYINSSTDHNLKFQNVALSSSGLSSNKTADSHSGGGGGSYLNSNTPIYNSKGWSSGKAKGVKSGSLDDFVESIVTYHVTAALAKFITVRTGGIYVGKPTVTRATWNKDDDSHITDISIPTPMFQVDGQKPNGGIITNGHTGKSWKFEFSDNTWMQFNNGILIDGRDKDGNVPGGGSSSDNTIEPTQPSGELGGQPREEGTV